MRIEWRMGEDKSPYGISRIVRKLPGVYLFCKKNDDDTWAVIYAGESKDLLEAFQFHFSSQEKNIILKRKLQSDRILYFFSFVYRSEDRAGIVKYLYDTFKPASNDKDPGGPRVVVNLPDLLMNRLNKNPD